MPNTILTHQMIAREAAAMLQEESPFISNINMARKDEFGAIDQGYKKGDSVIIKIPSVGAVFDGAIAGGGGAATDQIETSVTLQLSTQKHVFMQFGAKEKLLNITDFKERILRPNIRQLSSVVEGDLLARAYAMVPNVVGTPGTTATTMKTYSQARAKLQNYLAPVGDRSMIFSSNANVEMIDAAKQLFNPAKSVEGMFLRGYLGDAQGATFYEHQSIPVHTNGTQASWTVNGGSQTGSTLAIGGLTVANTIRRGTVFTIPGVFFVHPLTGVASATLQQFVVTADFTAAGTTGSIGIFPPITPTAPNKTVSASPANSAVCTMFGAAATSYPMDLMFQKDAFTVAFAPLPVLASTEGYTVVLPNGFSVRVMTYGSGDNDYERTRIDVLYGIAGVRPLHASRVTE